MATEPLPVMDDDVFNVKCPPALVTEEPAVRVSVVEEVVKVPELLMEPPAAMLTGAELKVIEVPDPITNGFAIEEAPPKDAELVPAVVKVPLLMVSPFVMVSAADKVSVTSLVILIELMV